MSEEKAATPAITKRPDRTPLSRRNPVQLAEHFWRSGYFKDVKSLSQAVVKVVFGEELGLGPGASMRGIHIIEESPSLSANTLATLIKRSERYDYRVRESTGRRCAIEFFEDGESVGTAEFTIQQAQKIKTRQKGQWISLATTLRWENSPVDMLFARCLTRGTRQFCPDVTAGSPAYTPEELTDEVDARGAPVFVESRVEVAEEERPRLDDETVDRFMRGYEIAGPELGGLTPLDGLQVLLGSLGFDAIDQDRKVDGERVGLTERIRDQVAHWPAEQVESVEDEFQRVIDAAAAAEESEPEEVDGEVVPDGEEASHADV